MAGGLKHVRPALEQTKQTKIKKDVLRKKMADMMAGGVKSKKANVGPNWLSFASSQLKCVRFTSLGLVLALC